MPLDWLTRLDPLRRIRCPFCFEQFAACEMHLRCDDPYCKTDFGHMIPDPILSKALNGPRVAAGAGVGATLRSPWWVDPRQDPRRGVRRHLDWMILPGSLDCPNCGKPTDVRLCPRCHGRLPDSAVTLEAGHIAIFGPQSVGKTTYVTVLIHELEHRVGPGRGFTLDPLTDDIRDRYDREYHELTYGGGGGQFGVGEGFDADQRRSHSATPSLETNRGVLQPLVYRVTARKGTKGKRVGTLLSFFDTAGEDWEMNLELLRSEARYLGQARGLLFLLDPLRIREVALDRRIKLTEKETRVPPADYLTDARKLTTFFPKTPVMTPLAIVLNKLDRWGGLTEPGSILHRLATSVPDERVDSSLDHLVHDEVQSALRRWGMTGFLDYMDLHFPNHRFFACSTLGDAAPVHDAAAQPLPTPILVDRPVLWLLERQNVIEPTRG